MGQNEVMVKMILDRWNALNKNFDDTLNSLTDEDLQREIAPGRNRGIYLLGHMVAAHDDMLRLLDFGDKKYPELYKPFLEAADKTVSDLPPAKELRTKWVDINNLMNQKLNALQPAQWFEKHTAVNAEDFAKEPHRNKLNIMVTRCTHLAYHHGQLLLLESKKTND